MHIPPSPFPMRSGLHKIADSTHVRTTGAKPSAVMLGDYTVEKKGASRFDLRDPYYFAVALTWPRFLVYLLALHSVINLSFALLYLGQPGAIANARPGSFADAFFFSVETSATVGYGAMYPATFFGHVVATVEILLGMTFTALMTGLLFVRFSRPKACIRYADSAVVASHGGQPTLMIRIANGRISLLSDATAHLSLLRLIHGDDGTIGREAHELPLLRSRLPMFALTWTLMHVIGASSPLHGYDAARLVTDDVRLFVAVNARDVTLATAVSDMKHYGPTNVAFGMRYADATTLSAGGRPIADLTRISRVEHDVGAEPHQLGWVDDCHNATS